MAFILFVSSPKRTIEKNKSFCVSLRWHIEQTSFSSSRLTHHPVSVILGKEPDLQWEHKDLYFLSLILFSGKIIALLFLIDFSNPAVKINHTVKYRRDPTFTCCLCYFDGDVFKNRLITYY